jgi:MoaD family protein
MLPFLEVGIMNIKLRYLGSIGVMLGRKEEEIEVSDAASMLDLLLKLTARYGEKFKEEVFESGCADLKAGYVALVNGIPIGRLKGVRTKLNPDDTIILMPTVSGGMM